MWRSNKRKSEPSVEFIKIWEEADENYFAPGVLVRVNQGKGILREVYGEIGDKSYLTLMFQDQTLFQLQGDEYFCPTCEKMLKSGYGLQQDFHLQMEKINQEKGQVGLLQAVENIGPLLGLLPSGYYVVADTTLYPTDGNGNLFWEVPNEAKYLKGTCIYYHGDGEWGDLRPYFTVATQPRQKFSLERMRYYLEHPDCRAVAYYMDGYMAALLDGHHKAMAAAVSHQPFNALVILPAHIQRWRNENGGFDDYLSFGVMDFPCRELSADGNRIEPVPIILEKVPEGRMKEIVRTIGECRLGDSFPIETRGLAAYYPTVEEQAEIERAGIITDDLLDQILCKKITYTGEEACILIKALSGLKHKRFKEIGIYFSSQPYSGPALYTILETMKKLPRDEEMEQFFLDKMIELEDEYPYIGRMILDYL